MYKKFNFQYFLEKKKNQENILERILNCNTPRIHLKKSFIYIKVFPLT